MFDFREKVLNPLIGKIGGEIDGALKTPTLSDRFENLLSVKEDADTRLLKISNREWIQTSVASIFMIGGLFAFSVSGAFLVGALALAALGGFTSKKAFNAGATEREANNIGNRINAQVSNLAAAHPQEAIKSARFQKELKKRFNLASAGENEATLLRALLMPPPAPAP